MNYSYHPLAKSELTEIINYYEDIKVGLGEDFYHELFNAIIRIKEFPEAWQKISDNTRRCLLFRFPFGIIYQIIDNEIFILAVMHLNKDPNYWKNRIS